MAHVQFIAIVLGLLNNLANFNRMSHHFIFEGAELAGKSWLMSQVYDHLEPKYNQTGRILDGCHWFNCDVGIYGTEYGKKIIKHYLAIAQELQDKNILFEKFHISDIVYNRLHHNRELSYKRVEEKLKELNFKIVLVAFKEDKKLLEKRIQDRLNLYPHYERILRNPGWYIDKQREYFREIKKSSLPYLLIETDKLPDQSLVKKILRWIKEL